MTSSGVETAILFLDLAGTIYPFQPSTQPAADPGEQPLSLVRLSCGCIVQDEALTSTALSCMPQSLESELLHAALVGKHDLAADLIIAHWSQPVLRLADIFPEGLFPDLSCAAFRLLQLQRIRDALSYTTAAASGFVHFLKRAGDGPGTLKCLDITGFPAAEVVGLYLLSHCIIAINERRQDMLWKRMLELRSPLPMPAEDPRGRPLYPRSKSFREGTGYVMRIDLRIDSEEMLDQLLPCFATKVDGRKPKLRASIGNLYVTRLRDSALTRVLETIPFLELTGLCLSFTRIGSLPASQLEAVLLRLALLDNLEALDLSNCCLNLAFRQVLCAKLQHVLKCLQRLRRLNLSMNRLTGVLSLIIPPSARLSHLALCGCRLKACDVRFLSGPDFWRRRVLHLDLSHLRLDTDPVFLHDAVCSSFLPVDGRAAWPRLKVLLLSDSQFDPPSLNALAAALLSHNRALLQSCPEPEVEEAVGPPLVHSTEEPWATLGPGLAYLDICESSSRMSVQGLLESFYHLFSISSLRLLKADYPHDCFSEPIGFLDLEKKFVLDNAVSALRLECGSDVNLVFRSNIGNLMGL